MRRILLLLATISLSVLLASGVAGAITYGQPDDPVNPEYPYVGAIVVSDDRAEDQKFVWCSGTLISPTVFLTAAHCLIDHERFAVTFEGVTFESTFNPETSLLYSGTLYAHPDFERFANYVHDIGVVVLDSPVEGVDEFGELPTAGLLDELYRDGGLRGEEFTSVGYGYQERTHEPGSGSPAFGDDERRMISTQLFRTLTKNHLKLSQNPALGYGGTCYGDSGGPVFLGGPSSNQLVALTSTGDAVCTATSVNYRLDTQEAQDFLAPFVTLPE
jgi:secreted trypsin-like serine protease